jgi:hypothetical protein
VENNQKSKKEIELEKEKQEVYSKKEEKENYKQFAYRVRNPFRGI